IQLTLLRRTGGRAPLAIACFAFTVSFLLCGLWHSVSWVWLAWGAIHAAGLSVCNLYRHALTKRLGRKGLNRYMADPRIHLVSTFVTFEFSAFALAVVFYPYHELTWPWPIFSHYP